MNSAELLKKIKKIEIRSRKLSQQIFAGEYHSAFKGRGMAFSEVRTYTYGDDVRFIDWNVTARFHQPYVKVFEEEREMTVMLVIDTSASTLFGTRNMRKTDMITELAAVLSFSAINNNDKVGVLFYSNTIEKFIPPQKGKTHILRIISELLNIESHPGSTNTSMALQYLTGAIKKKCTTFVISDFLDADFETALRIAGNKHDISGIQIRDRGEYHLPQVGYMQLYDKETGSKIIADTSSAAFRQQYTRWWTQNEQTVTDIFRRTGVDMLKIYTDEDYIPKLREFFKKRS